MMQTIYVVGYPRSGNTWLGHLLADALGCGYNSHDGEQCDYPGDQTDAPYLVRKSHAHETPDPEHTIFIYRDPRDVAVSLWYYLQLADLMTAIEGMNGHIDKLGVESYGAMWEAWRSQAARATVRYEHLTIWPAATLRRIIYAATGMEMDSLSLERAVNRQSFDVARRRYGPSQYHHARLGVPGNWRNYFARREGRVMQDCYGDVMQEQGYVTDSDWWEALPEKVEP